MSHSNLYNYMNSRSNRKRMVNSERFKTRKITQEDMVHMPIPGLKGTWVQVHKDATEAERKEKIDKYLAQHSNQLNGLRVTDGRGGMH